MTPKEKASELVAIYRRMLPMNQTTMLDAKNCALIAVEFARDQFDNYCCAEMNTVGSPDDHFDVLKQEIEKL